MLRQSLSQLVSSAPQEPSAEAMAELSNARAALAANMEEVATLRQSIKDLEESALVCSNSLKEELRQFQQRLAASDAERAQCTHRLQLKTDEAALAAAQTQALQIQFSDMVEESNRMGIDLTRLREELAMKDERLMVFERDLSVRSEDLAEARSVTQRQELEIIVLQSKVAAAEDELQNNVQELDRERIKSNDSLSRLRELQSTVDQLASDLMRDLMEANEVASSEVLTLLELAVQMNGDQQAIQLAELQQSAADVRAEILKIDALREPNPGGQSVEYSKILMAELIRLRKVCIEKFGCYLQKGAEGLAALKLRTQRLEEDKVLALSDLSNARDELETAQAENVALREATSRVAEMSMSADEMGALVHELEVYKARDMERDEGSDLRKALVRVRELEEELVSAELSQRVLRNQIAELKGNVRVFARMRPLLSTESSGGGEGSAPSILVNTDRASIVVLAQKERMEDQLFSFDKAFGPEASQDDIFTEVAEYIQSAMDGYNGELITLIIEVLSKLLSRSLSVQLWANRKWKDAHYDRNRERKSAGHRSTSFTAGRNL